MTPNELADRLDRCDHLVMMDRPDDPVDDMVETAVPAYDHDLIVCSLRENAELRALLAEIQTWMDADMGEWDARFIAKIDAALTTGKRDE